MTRPLIAIFIGLLLTLTCNNGVCQPPSGEDNTEEIQLLIDVSGSMKQNDPQNLRVEATKLLINLLPDAAKVSLWLFAEKTTSLIHSDTVDAAWKQQALKASNNIHSRGLFTHIEDAIQTVLQNGFTGSGNKHLIILTDGMVDISKDIMVSADSRERILSEWIPKLQQQNIKVQTIALSDQADKELLEKLAFDTGGWTETADSAEQLQRAFLKMAQKAAPKDTLPLNDNRFSVDGSIKEFSVLAFKKDRSAPTQLIAPDRNKIAKSSALPTTSWLENGTYDLITVKQPLPGDWQIEAAIDPDNQVMILTDLKLQLDELPNFIGLTDNLPLKAHFTEQNQLIARADFLNLITLSLSIDDQSPISMHPVNGEPGYFAHTLSGLPQGKHSLTITADGKTFKREIVRDIEVVATPISVEKQIDKATREITLKLLPDTAVIDTASMIITAAIHQADNPAQTQEISAENGAWMLKLPPLPPGVALRISFNATAKTPDGKTITPVIPPITLDDNVFTASETETAPVEESPAAEHPQKAEVAENIETQPTETNWGLTIAIVLAGNLLVIGAGFMIYTALKKANAAKQQQLLERLA